MIHPADQTIHDGIVYGLPEPSDPFLDCEQLAAAMDAEGRGARLQLTQEQAIDVVWEVDKGWEIVGGREIVLDANGKTAWRAVFLNKSLGRHFQFTWAEGVRRGFAEDKPFYGLDVVIPTEVHLVEMAVQVWEPLPY